MAGFRTQPSPYIEVSAVCTHPDHHGKGYARQLVRRKTQQILTTAGFPFLHVRNDNYTAIKLYQKLGFVIRTEINFNLIRKAE
jgi:predicted GNAT family acetyltransferase